MLRRHFGVVLLLVASLFSIAHPLCAEEEVKPTLVVFSADWCAYCQKAKKDMVQEKDLKAALEKFNVIEADFDVDKELVKKYNIRSIPTFVIIKDGKATKKTGYSKPKDLLDFLK